MSRSSSGLASGYRARLVVLGVLVLLAAGASPAMGRPTAIGTIQFPGEPLAVGVHQGLNRVFVTEDDTGKLHTLDGTTFHTVGSATAGGSAFGIAVNETHKKVYVASDEGCCTTGLSQENGLISVVDAETGALLGTIDPGPPGSVSLLFALANDEVHDKVYVSFGGTLDRGVGVIDAATDEFTQLSDDVTSAAAIAVNTVTNKAYIPDYGDNKLVVIDGATNGVTAIGLGGTGGSGPLDIAVGEPENKVYVTMLHQPGSPYIGILILDRDTGGHSFVGHEDLEPLVFNQATNRLFAGVQVGQRGAIVEGVSDALTYVELEPAESAPRP